MYQVPCTKNNCFRRHHDALQRVRPIDFIRCVSVIQLRQDPGEGERCLLHNFWPVHLIPTRAVLRICRQGDWIAERRLDRLPITLLVQGDRRQMQKLAVPSDGLMQCQPQIRANDDYYDMHQMIPDILNGNVAFLDSLSEEERAIFEEGFLLVNQVEREEWTSAIENAKERAQNQQGVQFNYPDTAPFQEACAPLHESMLASSPNLVPIYEAIQAYNAQYPSTGS